MNPITFDEWGAQETILLWATENGGNASGVINFLEQTQINYEASKESGSARWIFIITTVNQKVPEIISRLNSFKEVVKHDEYHQFQSH